MKQSILSKDGVSYVVPFILITSCFALWGFANDITNPMVKAFSKIFRMSATDGALVQVAFYGGYFAMAFPAAIFIRRFSYKAGVLVGLGLYALGAFLFYPAKMTGDYYPFLFAYFILTCGLSFLETSSNPYVLSMGTEETATRRLNLAQSFNPMGSLLGMFVAMNFIQAKLNPLDTASRTQLSESEFEAVKEYDLSVLIGPYLVIGLVILVMFLVILFWRMPKNGDKNHAINFIPTLRRIFSLPHYREGVIAQFFYVGVQIMCWTFIIQYGTRVFMAEGMAEQQAENLEKKKALCEKAEALKDSTDWKATAEILTKLQKEWKTIGPVSKKHSDAVWKRFIGACDHFFAQKNKANSSQRSVESDNMAKKENIISQLHEIEKAGNEDESVADKIRGLIKEWNGIGHVPFKEKDRLYNDFHSTVDRLFAKLNITASEKKLSSFKSNLSSGNNLYRDREKLVRTYEGLKNDIQTYENNLGFLTSASKKGNSLVQDIQRKIERLKGDMELVTKKIAAIDEKLRESK